MNYKHCALLIIVAKEWFEHSTSSVWRTHSNQLSYFAICRVNHNLHCPDKCSMSSRYSWTKRRGGLPLNSERFLVGLPRLELRIQQSKCCVLTNYTIVQYSRPGRIRNHVEQLIIQRFWRPLVSTTHAPTYNIAERLGSDPNAPKCTICLAGSPYSL